MNTLVNYGNLFAITLPETILEVVSLLVLIVDLAWLRKAAQATRMATACALGVAGSLLAVLWLIAHPISMSFAGGALVATPLVAAAQIGIVLLTALVLLLSLKAEFSRNPGEFVAIVLLATTGMMLVVAARDLLIIFVALELLSLSLYVLTAFAKSSAQSAEAALKYYLFGGMSAALMLFGFSYLYGLTGTTNLSQMTYPLSGQETIPLAVVALVLVAAGLGFKIAAVPFHLWTPDTYQGAPAPVAALIASGSKVASFALLVAVTEGFVAPPSSETTGHSLWIVLLLTMAAGSIVLGNLAALAQSSAPLACLFGHRPRRLYAARHCSAHTAERRGGALLRANVRAHHCWGLRRHRHCRTRHRKRSPRRLRRPEPAQSAVGGDHACLSPVACRNSSPGRLLGQIQPLCAVLRSETSASWSLTLVVLALAASAVSLFYYLQVLKRVYVVKSATTKPMPVSFVELATLTAIALAVLLLGVFPGLLSAWIPLG